MARGRFIIAITSAALAAACAPDTATRLSPDGALSAPGIDTRARAQGVDPALVGDRLMQAGEFELALASYNRAAAAQGLTPDLMHAMAAANVRLGRLGQAERMLRRLLVANPDSPELLNDLGVVLMKQDEVAEARLVFQKAFALDSGDSPEIRENLRVALAKLEKPSYSDEEKDAFDLVRRGNGVFTLAQQDP